LTFNSLFNDVRTKLNTKEITVILNLNYSTAVHYFFTIVKITSKFIVQLLLKKKGHTYYKNIEYSRV